MLARFLRHVHFPSLLFANVCFWSRNAHSLTDDEKITFWRWRIFPRIFSVAFSHGKNNNDKIYGPLMLCTTSLLLGESSCWSSSKVSGTRLQNFLQKPSFAINFHFICKLFHVISFPYTCPLRYVPSPGVVFMSKIFGDHVSIHAEYLQMPFAIVTALHKAHKIGTLMHHVCNISWNGITCSQNIKKSSLHVVVCRHIG